MVCEMSELRERQNTHHPHFRTRDVGRRFCGGGAWLSRSDTVGSFLLAVELLCLQWCLGAFCLHLERFLVLQLELFYLLLKPCCFQCKTALIST